MDKGGGPVVGKEQAPSENTRKGNKKGPKTKGVNDQVMCIYIYLFMIAQP